MMTKGRREVISSAGLSSAVAVHSARHMIAINTLLIGELCSGYLGSEDRQHYVSFPAQN